ncbi:rho GTPase-activating protein 24-like isoform X2 [Anneissia japonica]|uniref:rho GTPase-activating protein 24-like isoform X2 n=1 Tax=Anneissia japonica TaxID=1529436 RepID=UPI001425583F|nr:rho GTPase-activating protein 24-like isoform X2 [Anneissia japonica]
MLSRTSSFLCQRGISDDSYETDPPDKILPEPVFNTNTTDILYSGWLKTHQGMLFKSWQKCWFVLADGHLHYFKLLGSMPLEGTKLSSRLACQPDEPEGCILSIKPGNEQHGCCNKPLSLCASTQFEAEKWERQIRRIRGGVFGQSLEDTITDESETTTRLIPYVVETSVAYLRKYGLTEEGIFRLNGRAGLIQELQDAFDCGQRPNLEDFDVDVHTVASLLKRYFQMLPEPVIPWAHYKFFENAIRTLFQNEERGRHELIIQIALLPRINYNLLKFLCDFLNEVHKYERQNKMGLGNLANVFAPHILRPRRAGGFILLGSTALSLQLVHYLIKNPANMFPPTNMINFDAGSVARPRSIISMHYTNEAETYVNLRHTSLNNSHMKDKSQHASYRRNKDPRKRYGFSFHDQSEMAEEIVNQMKKDGKTEEIYQNQIQLNNELYDELQIDNSKKKLSSHTSNGYVVPKAQIANGNVQGTDEELNYLNIEFSLNNQDNRSTYEKRKSIELTNQLLLLQKKLTQKEEDFQRQKKKCEKTQRQMDSLKLRLYGEEAARAAAEEQSRRLLQEVDSLRKRLGLRKNRSVDGP